MEEVVQLTEKERLAVKSMWSEIFFEDSDRFTDYYFAEKMSNNKGYGVKVNGELVSMMFLTPYPVWIKAGGADEPACAASSLWATRTLFWLQKQGESRRAQTIRRQFVSYRFSFFSYLSSRYSHVQDENCLHKVIIIL